MGIQDLQNFLELASTTGTCVPVDLLRIVRNNRGKLRGKSVIAIPPSTLNLVVDGECCLDRLYGGYFSDWACGGQWNRMVQFLATLIQTVQSNNIQLSFFFNGCVETQRMSEWVNHQLLMRQKINQVLRHVNIKGTPPPKIWWTPPVCLRTCLRMALRHLSVGLMCTMDDHHQEVIAYCRENNCNGLMADDGEYAVFDPPRYFSSENIKLTYKGSLETKEYVMSEVTKQLGLSGGQMCILASLLGNYFLPESELLDIYQKIGIKEPMGRVQLEQLIMNLCQYVKSLPDVSNLDVLTESVFGSNCDKRANKFQQSVKYYMNGTKEGFLSYKPPHPVRRPEKSVSKPVVDNKPNNVKKETDEALDYSRLASEDVETQQESLARYKEATANSLPAPQIVIEPPIGSSETEVTHKKLLNGAGLLLSSSSSSSSSSAPSPSRLNGTKALIEEEEERSKPLWLLSIPHEVMRTACERHEKGLMSPLIYQIFTQGEIKFPVVMEEDNHKEVPNIQVLFRPIRQCVYAVLFNIHHHKYMASKTNKDKSGSDSDSPYFKDGRDLKDAKEVMKDVSSMLVKEWIWSKENPYLQPDLVAPEQLNWGVPTIQRLWFGASLDDKRRRLRAFLTCMRSDTPLMLNTAYVPQHLLVMASVLRYIMTISTEKQILRKPELDAFIAQAFSPELMNAAVIQELQLPMVNSRGIQLAAMFMTGVENALLANDACGAPIPWLMCCPWLYFDGKLFHHKLSRVGLVKNLLEFCDHRIEMVVKVERMRKAVLEGLDVKFATPQLPQVPICHGALPPPPGSLLSSAIGPILSRNSLKGLPPYGIQYRANTGIGRGGGLLRRQVPARGGQLEVAGVVVGQWGANYGSRGGSIPRMPARQHSSHQPPPQVTSVGGLKNYRGPMSHLNFNRPAFNVAGRGMNNRTVPNFNGGQPKKNNNNKKKKATKEPKGRALTIEVANGDSVPVSAFSVIPIALKTESEDDFSPDTSMTGQFDDAVHINTIATQLSNMECNGIIIKEELGQGDAGHNVQ